MTSIKFHAHLKYLEISTLIIKVYIGKDVLACNLLQICSFLESVNYSTAVEWIVSLITVPCNWLIRLTLDITVLLDM